MYLPDRGAAERRVVEPGEYAAGAARRSSSITSAISSVGTGGTSSCIFASSVRYAAGQGAAPRREHLPELDEQRPEFLARKPEMLGTSLLFRIVLQHAIIDDAEPEHRDDLAVPLPFSDLVVSDGDPLRLHVESRPISHHTMSLIQVRCGDGHLVIAPCALLVAKRA